MLKDDLVVRETFVHTCFELLRIDVQQLRARADNMLRDTMRLSSGSRVAMLSLGILGLRLWKPLRL
jgi:hypothetical protein